MKLFLAVFLSFFSPESLAADLLLTDVPFKTQSPPGDWQKNLNCGPAAAVMVAGYYNDFLPAAADLEKSLDWLYDNEYIAPQTGAEYYDGNVTTSSILKNLLSDHFGLSPVVKKGAADLSLLENQLKKGNPVIVGVNVQMNPQKIGHFMVLLGLSADEVIVHDPGLALGAFKKYSLDKFFLSWQTSNNTVIYVDANKVTWHPDGTLIQSPGQAEIYILIGGKKHWIVNEAVFNSHNFDWNKVVMVSEAELNCYENDWPVDWQPYREVFIAKGKYYMMEKSSIESNSCAIYEFGSELSFVSWNLAASAKDLTALEAELKYFSKCELGGLLYVRDGAILKPDFPIAGFSGITFFTTTANGTLLPFASEEVFSGMGYDGLSVLAVDEEMMKGSYNAFGKTIDFTSAAQCGDKSLAISGGSVTASGQSDPVDADGDGFSMSLGDCNDNNSEINPTAEEICDGVDNNCDGKIDDGPDCVMTVSPPIDSFVPAEDVSSPSPEIVAGVDTIDDLTISGEVLDDNPENSDHDVSFSNTLITDTKSLTLDTLITDTQSLIPSLSVACTISCLYDMQAFIWYSDDGEVSGFPAVMNSTEKEICLRGKPWIDFNCAGVSPWLWSSFDSGKAQVECNHAFQAVIPGVIDAKGEGEIWFTDFFCYQD